jgi:uncharacterized protein YndB with AHSA1/START domain
MFAIIGGAVVAILGFLGFVSTRPSSFRVERRGRFNAPPERVFAKLNDFREWASWSPWEGLDPNMQRTMSGAQSGPGSIYEWEGNRNVGKGRMEIVSADPPRKLNIKLDFLKPFEAHNMTEFTIEPRDGGSELTWAMTGDSPFMSKLMGVFMNFDKLIGKDFEKGLASLKTKVE